MVLWFCGSLGDCKARTSESSFHIRKLHLREKSKKKKKKTIIIIIINDDKLAMNPTQFPTWITWFPCLKFSLHSPPGVWCQQQIRRRLLLQRPGLYLLERLRPACAEHEGTAPLLLKRESDEGFWVRPAVWRSRFRSASGFIRSAPLFSPPSFFPSSFAPCAAHSCFSGSDSHSRSKDTTYRLRHVVKINSESERLENEPARLGVGRGEGEGGRRGRKTREGFFFFASKGDGSLWRLLFLACRLSAAACRVSPPPRQNRCESES